MRQAYSSRSSIAMAGEKAKPRTFVRGFQTYSSGIGYLLLALLLLTRLLLAALLLLTRLLLAALLLLTGLLLAALLATLLLLAGLLVWILIHRSFLSNIGCHFDRSFSMARVNPRPMHSFHDSFTIHAEAMCLELGLACRVPLATRRTDVLGRYMLLWLVGVPIPILVLIWLFGGLH